MLALTLVLLAGAFEPARLESYTVDPVPFGARSAGIVITEMSLDAQGAPVDFRVLKDVAPFSDLLKNGRWRFTPARVEGKPVPTQVLVVGIFRPAMLQFAAPASPPPPRAMRTPGFRCPSRCSSHPTRPPRWATRG